ncbi:MAG: hypothetical protein WA130_01190 [Candidatus Methanoperedens sp.]
MHENDAIIAGASFAGLAAADSLDGDILLLDRKEIGTRQTSACATFTSVLEDSGCKSLIMQEFDTLTLHIPDEKKVELIEPISTFDYEKFCKNSGNFSSQCILDCTGWRAVLASSLRQDYVDRRNLAFGLESEVDYTDDSLHFFIDPNIIQQGAAWIFPIGNKSRIGVASYAGKTRILPQLCGFLGTLGQEISKTHGGYIPFGLREPVVDNLFMVGDSAGMAPPTTSEGIRPAINFGRECAGIVQGIIDGDKKLKDGLIEYTDIVNKSKNRYKWLLNMQTPLLDNIVPGTIKKAACSRIFSKLFQKMYLGI